MDPDIILIFALLICFLVYSIYSLVSFFKRSFPVSGRMLFGLLLLLTSALILYTIPYYLFYTFQDFHIIAYYIILFLAFCISLNVSRLVTIKIIPQYKSKQLSITFCFLTILLSFIIFLIIFYLVRLIDTANLLGNE